MMGLLIHRWLSSDEGFVFVSLLNNQAAPIDRSHWPISSAQTLTDQLIMGGALE